MPQIPTIISALDALAVAQLASTITSTAYHFLFSPGWVMMQHQDPGVVLPLVPLSHLETVHRDGEHLKPEYV